uniref:uncharacterized protein LOC122581647 n=1 Tax=Erigeron canadensis TaxID=72917 RepID=UPI001CB8B390|nr:uncharacterized protein LOC122581647 [Erigeron canadensis]
MEIDDDNSCNSTKTKKKPLDLGWNRLLPTTSSGHDDGRSPELIITTSTNKFDGGGGEVHAPQQEDQKDDLGIMTKTDDEINECIARKRNSFQVLGKRLPDKGEKFMADIRRLEIELERRNKLKLEKETCEAEVKQEVFEAEDGNPVQKKKRGRSPILQAKQPNGLQKDRQRMVDTPSAEPSSPDIEVVREMQEHGGDNGDGSSQQKKKRVHRKKGADEPRLKTKPIAWTNDEQMSLAKAWLEVTEDPMCSNYQRERTYWRKIVSVFLSLVAKPAGYRDLDGVSSKWRKMRKSIQAFNNIFTRISANQHPNGASDETIQQRALQEYQAMKKPSFHYLAEWEYLRHSLKFAQVVDFDPESTRAEPSAKRLRTTSSADPQSQGSDARCDMDPKITEEEGERYVHQCPIGRGTAKKATSSGSSGWAKYTEMFEKISDKLEGLIDIGKKRVELEERKLELEERKLKLIETKQKRADLNILSTDYSHLSGAERQLAEQIKQDIREKYGLM